MPTLRSILSGVLGNALGAGSARPKASGKPRHVDAVAWRLRLMAADIDESLAAMIAELVRPSIALRTQDAAPDNALPIGRSKLGGRPDLPNGTPWPMRKRYRLAAPRGSDPGMEQTRPLAFLAQINLSDAAVVGGTSLPLPASGLLSFFYDAEFQPWGFDPGDAEGFKLMWFEDRDLRRLAPPEELAKRFEFNSLPLSLEPRDCVPPPETFAMLQILRRGVVAAKSRDHLQRIFIEREESEEFLTARHALGGWPCPIQQEMETECQLAASGIFCGSAEGFASPRAVRLRAGAADWRLVLQLSSDEHAGWAWGDGGKLYIWMREQDLHTRRFDRCWTILQCH